MQVPEKRHMAIALAITALVHLSPLVCEPSTARAGTVYDFELVGGGGLAGPGLERLPGSFSGPKLALGSSIFIGDS